MASKRWPFFTEGDSYLERCGRRCSCCCVQRIIATALPYNPGTGIGLLALEALPLHTGIGGQSNAAGPGGVAGRVKLDRTGWRPAANSSIVTHHIDTLADIGSAIVAGKVNRHRAASTCG